ncbi:RNA polymerase subunit AC19 [Bonamia ostreae]|uniref:RNA polymerase subunit AC19 n=1 Tax=Bonamia ostreae TaxID=126728 RepID=A0ABV2AGJ9_9EUKA
MAFTPKAKIVRQKISDDGLCGTFYFVDEGHTIGNILKYLLAKRKDVAFSGYNVPHPNNNLMTVRVEAKKGHCPVQILKETFKTLIKLCSVLETKFKNAFDEK